MRNKLQKVGFGGGCHWCTEAVFQSIIGVVEVAQGFIASSNKEASFSEAVIVHFNPSQISLKELVEIHLYTHKSSSDHSMRKKYRSAIYFFDKDQQMMVNQILNSVQKDFKKKIITKILPFHEFKFSDELFHNYYYTNPEKPFCETYINPKLSLLLQKFSKHVDKNKITQTELVS